MTDCLPPAAPPEVLDQIRSVYADYRALTTWLDPVHALGGRLLYAGVLGPETEQLLRAANIAGAASLAVSASSSDLRQAMRLGVVDFIVSSLDEALRILKNELRKRLPVAVAVEGVPLELGNQMMQRGVQPDLLTPAIEDLEPLCARVAFLERDAQLVEAQPDSAETPLRIWHVPDAWKARMAELDARLLEMLPATAYAERRWLRLSPRYLGTAARRLRSVACDTEFAEKLEAVLLG